MQTDGVDVTLSGSDSTDDVITIVGANDVTVTQSSGTITIDAPHENDNIVSVLTLPTPDSPTRMKMELITLCRYLLWWRLLLASLLQMILSRILMKMAFDTDLDLTPYLDNTDTTYSVSTTNAVSGANIVLTAGGSGSGTDSVSIVGGDNVTVYSGKTM